MLLIYVFTLWNIGVTGFGYYILKKKRELYDDRLGMTITMTASMMSAMVIGMHTAIIFPLEYTLGIIFNIALGVIVGFLFGSLTNSQHILTGLYNGLVGAIMGFMLGKVTIDPQLCDLPFTSKQSILLNMYQLCGFTTLLLTIAIGLTLYSLKGKKGGDYEV